MKKGIMHDLYWGGNAPWERRSLKNPEYEENSRQIGRIKEYLKGSIPPEIFKQVEKLESLYTEASMAEEEEIFRYGLSMGILLVTEAFRFGEQNTSGRSAK